MEYYHFEIFVDESPVHTEIFKSTPENATKYIAYKEQFTRENVNYLRPENKQLLVTSKYYKNTDKLHIIDDNEINSMEKILKEISELRCKLVETFRKLKHFCIHNNE
jgi:hypothetical protein